MLTPRPAFHVSVPAGAEVKPRMIARLRQQLGEAASGQSDLASGHRVTITRAWALNRARRCGLSISDVGDVVELDVDALRVTQEPRPQSWLAARLQGPVKVLLRVWARARRHLSTLLGTALRIRSPRDLWRFLADDCPGHMVASGERPLEDSTRLDLAEASADAGAEAVEAVAEAGEDLVGPAGQEPALRSPAGPLPARGRDHRLRASRFGCVRGVRPGGLPPSATTMWISCSSTRLRPSAPSPANRPRNPARLWPCWRGPALNSPFRHSMQRP